MSALLLVWCIASALPAAAHAGPINLGIISYDSFIPGDVDAPGVNGINIGNLTGDPLFGGFALDSDFPSFTPVTFLDSSLTLVVDGATRVMNLGNLGPGFFDSSLDLLFPATAVLSSLLFSATLSTTSFLLADGSTFVADSSVLMLNLAPMVNPGFTPGLDFGVMSVEGTVIPNPVPEPATVTLLVSGLTGVVIRSRVRARRRRAP